MNKKRARGLKKLMSVILASALFGTFFLGCAGISKERNTMCPKCGTVLPVKEGFKNTNP